MSAMTIDQAMQRAVQHHQEGRLAEAEAIYRQILGVAPQHPDALHNLGMIAYQTGHGTKALELIRAAIQSRPNHPPFLSNLGHLLWTQNQFDDAVAVLRTAVQLQPDYAEAHCNLGNVLWSKGQPDQAIAACKTAIRLKPDYAEAYNNLGNALADQNRKQEAVEAFRAAVRLKPDYAEAHSNLGNTLKESGHLDLAIASFCEAVRWQPAMLGAHNNLGNAFLLQGRLDQAIACYESAARLEPSLPEVHSNLGTAFCARGLTDRAAASLQTALQLRPDFAEAHHNLGNVFKSQGRLNDAIASFRKAVQIRPDFAIADSSFIFTLLYHPDFSAEAIAAEARRWDKMHAERLGRSVKPFPNRPDPDRRLKIGYVSPDFCDHCAGRLMLALFGAHDHQRYEIFAYAHVLAPDVFTAKFQSLADHWRGVVGLSDGQVENLIRQDGIDILVDLTMHMANNRLLLFARKPAPIQITYLAYPGTTGMPTIDYRISDVHLDPDAPAEARYTEKTIRLPDTFWCYEPVEGRDMPVSALPAATNGYVTFGCLNNFCKINDGVLDLWIKILHAVPGSRLKILAPIGTPRQRVSQRMEAAGVCSQRIDFLDFRPRPQYLELYHSLDLSLDTFPYNGHTTSLDGLWMGVPVVTLVGKTIVGRAGFSQMTNLHLPEFINDTPEEYVQTAVKMAADLPYLSRLRATLRRRMEISPLMDAPRFARGVEAAFRQVWTRWCADHRV